jgi:hypothetical protein
MRIHRISRVEYGLRPNSDRDAIGNEVGVGPRSVSVRGRCRSAGDARGYGVVWPSAKFGNGCLFEAFFSGTAQAVRSLADEALFSGTAQAVRFVFASRPTPEGLRPAASMELIWG